MKSCTDLGQSKKLSEILSLDSADMVITFDYINREYTQNKPIARPYLEFRTELLRYYDEEEADRRAVPCWSLSALLDILPEHIRFDGHTWKFQLDHGGIYYMNAYTYFSSGTGVLVDDAFETILGLKEKTYYEIVHAGLEQSKKLSEIENKLMKIGDRIFYQKNGEFYSDRIADIEIIDGSTIYELVDYDWWCVTEDELLDESDERVRDYMCLRKDGLVKLSDVRRWLESHATTYYEPDSWSLFKSDEMIKDLCKAMLYN